MRRNARTRNKLSRESTALAVTDLEVRIEKIVRKVFRQEIGRLIQEDLPVQTHQVIKEEMKNLSNQQLQSEKTSKEHPLEKFMEKFGAWEDDRTDEEIIKEIYDSRSFSTSEDTP